jgi:hypothetical protein
VIYQAWIGVDPGAKSYSCLLCPEKKLVTFKSNIDKPVDIYTWYQEVMLTFNIKMTLIEDVHNIFGVSSKSNFQFGFNTGLITGIIQATGYSLDKIPPKVWHKKLGITSTGKDIKKEVAEKAISLYPYANVTKPRGSIDLDKTDALMLAHTARLMYP